MVQVLVYLDTVYGVTRSCCEAQQNCHVPPKIPPVFFPFFPPTSQLYLDPHCAQPRCAGLGKLHLTPEEEIPFIERDGSEQTVNSGYRLEGTSSYQGFHENKIKAVTNKMLNVENLPHLTLAGKTILMMAITENGQKDGCFH